MDSYLSETRRAKKESSDLKLEVQQLRNSLKSQTENQDAAIALAKQEGADEASQKLKQNLTSAKKSYLKPRKLCNGALMTSKRELIDLLRF